MLYIIGITGNNKIRNKQIADYLKTYLEIEYKELYKQPNHRKYINVVIDSYQSALDSTIMHMHDISFNKKININKETLYREMRSMGNGVLWDNIMLAKLANYEDMSNRKHNYDFYIIIPDINTENQLNIIRNKGSTIIFNYETEMPVTRYDYFAYRFLNFKRRFKKLKTELEYLYNTNDIWFLHNKPDYYIKTWCSSQANVLVEKNIFGVK